MAEIYRVNGNVGAINDGKGFISTAVGASFIGKALKAFSIRVVGTAGPKDLSTELGVNGAFQDMLKTISANTTVLAYQVEPNSTGNVSILLEGADYLTYTNIQNIIRTGGNGAGGYGNSSPQLDAGSSLVADTGFKLATS